MNILKSFRTPDGTNWGVEVKVPGASNAMVVFHHPGGRTARLDRYAWYIWHGPESHNVTSRIPDQKVMDALTDQTLTRLFRRSMPVSPGATPLQGPGGEQLAVGDGGVAAAGGSKKRSA
jgi:hypothetical protein